MEFGLFNELTLKQSLDLFYSIFGYDRSAEPKLADLDKGFPPEYVYRKFECYMAGIGHQYEETPLPSLQVLGQTIREISRQLA